MRCSAALFTLALVAVFGCSTTFAQDSKPLRILVGFPPGGGTDVVARTLSRGLNDALAVPVLVENRPGAGGQIAAQALRAATPDGKTLFITHDHTISILPHVIRNPGFDPRRDFVPVAGCATFVNALAVSGGTPARNFNDYVAWVRSRGGRSAIGIPAPASVPEFLVKVIADNYKLDLVAAPYRGSAPMIADMLGSQIPAAVGSVPELIENHRAGKLRVVAVLGGARQSVMPEVPTFTELGLAGFEDVPYYGFFAPAGTPQALIDEFSSALARVLAMPDVRERLTTIGLTIDFMTQRQLDARVRAYTRTWTEIIRRTGFQPQ